MGGAGRRRWETQGDGEMGDTGGDGGEMGDAGGRGRWRETGGSKEELKREGLPRREEDGEARLNSRKGRVGRRRKTPMMMRRRGEREAAWPHFPCKSLSSTRLLPALMEVRGGPGRAWPWPG